MTRGRLLQILLIVGSILIIIGVSLIGWMLNTEEDRNVIVVVLSDNPTNAKEIEFESLALVPGEKCEYEIILKKDKAHKGDSYKLSLDFVELEESPLKEYARVKILSNGTVVHDELLANVLEGGDIVFTVDFSEGENTSLKLLYYLPLEVGNEAKNAGALFKLVLTASGE